MKNNKKNKIPKISNQISPLCRKDCKVCNSGFIDFVHEEIKKGTTYTKICSILLKEHNFSVSPSSLTRHISNYRENLKNNTNERLIPQFNEDSDFLKLHQNQAIILAEKIYKNITEQVDAGSIKFSIDDWEKVLKLRHLVLKGDLGASEDLMAIFAKASNKYGVSVNQGILFTSPKN
jgi:hypothetical protein